MNSFEEILNKEEFSKQDIITLLSSEGEQKQMLLKKALETKLKYVGNDVHLRGLIEYSNICEKYCLYCGVRNKNNKVIRYTITDQEVLDCARLALKLGYGSIAIQSGERTDEDFINKICFFLKEIKKLSDGKIGITLSCGEQTKETYKRWFDCGAHRYLLRIESSNKELFYRIHPKDDEHNFENRLRCIDDLINLGYQTGTGVMIGLPFQTIDNLADDLIYFKKKNVAMVGMGPFIAHPDTPLWKFKDNIPSNEQRMSMTEKMIGVLRLMMKEINMVAATADQTIDKQGREKAIIAGANVIMPNLTPNRYREEYLIYPDKACVGDKPEECYQCLDLRMRSIKHKILYNAWGDSIAFLKQHKKQENE
ncbi:MAG: [FeFe] hydrogenase H-cluster radical SAM maturase HydE [Bacteroidales bacterium]|jgi:biotin synthase|nr:[FeFe] hydrogenase H-cluster radical SAM maturase HydE [Bacteroidales bacterium]